MVKLTPILTPNLYGDPVCGNITDHPSIYRNNIVLSDSVTSSAFADDMNVFLPEAVLPWTF